jgi:hypothetical protein
VLHPVSSVLHSHTFPACYSLGRVLTDAEPILSCGFYLKRSNDSTTMLNSTALSLGRVLGMRERESTSRATRAKARLGVAAARLGDSRDSQRADTFGWLDLRDTRLIPRQAAGVVTGAAAGQ